MHQFASALSACRRPRLDRIGGVHGPARRLFPAARGHVALDHVFDYAVTGDAVAAQDRRRGGTAIDQKRQQKAGAVAGRLRLETFRPLHRPLQRIVGRVAFGDAGQQPVHFPVNDARVGAAGQ